MRIFDEITRTDETLAGWSTPEFEYLNRSARAVSSQVRQLIESWYLEYPEEHRSELRRRLRSLDDFEFYSAFFELYLHTLCRRSGYRVEVHPELESGSLKRPDFLVAPPDAERFYLEAIVATGHSDEERRAQRLLGEIYDALNEIDSPNFFIGLRLAGGPSGPIPRRKLIAAVERFLRQLDADEVDGRLRAGGIDALPREVFEHEDWAIEYFASPKAPEWRGKPGVQPVGTRFHEPRTITPSADIKAAIARKAGRYGDLPSSYVVAVNVLNEHVSDPDTMDALFGKQRWPFPSEGIDREPDGAWIGPKGPHNTRVSGAFIVHRLTPWTVAQQTPVLAFNPYAKIPLADVLPSVRQARPSEGKMVFSNGENGSSLFGLPDGWPLGELPPN